MTYRLRKVGTDLELFLRDKSGKPIPVCGLLGGTKEAPRPILPTKGKGFAVQEDNVMVEFNVPAAQHLGEWLNNLRDMETYLIGYFDAKDLVIACEPSMRFLPEQLQSEQARTFGCDPDINIWKMEANEIDRNDPDLESLRTAGGHIHIGFDVDDRPAEPPEVTRLVKLLDLYLGVPSVTFDKDQTRRKFYGKAGSFRPKPYGLEYRVLSNAWFKERYRDWAWESVQMAFHHLERRGNDATDRTLEEHGDKIQECISTGDPKLVEYFRNNFNLFWPLVEEHPKKKASKKVYYHLRQETELALGEAPIRQAINVDVPNPAPGNQNNWTFHFQDPQENAEIQVQETNRA